MTKVRKEKLIILNKHIAFFEEAIQKGVLHSVAYKMLIVRYYELADNVSTEQEAQGIYRKIDDCIKKEQELLLIENKNETSDADLLEYINRKFSDKRFIPESN